VKLLCKRGARSGEQGARILGAGILRAGSRKRLQNSKNKIKIIKNYKNLI
jgi:hypothetical protein